MEENKVLDVRHMQTYFFLDEGVLKAVDDVSYAVGARETLGVIAEIADQVCVMYLGKVVEQAETREIFKRPVHPYTVRLLRSLPTKQAKGRRLESIKGTVPIPLDFPEICGFFSRCTEAKEGVCNGAVPELEEVAVGHQARCFFARRFAAGEAGDE